MMGLLQKAASGVLAIFPCSHIVRMLRTQQWLRPSLRKALGQDWAIFFEPTPGY